MGIGDLLNVTNMTKKKKRFFFFHGWGKVIFFLALFILCFPVYRGVHTTKNTALRHESFSFTFASFMQTPEDVIHQPFFCFVLFCFFSKNNLQG